MSMSVSMSMSSSSAALNTMSGSMSMISSSTQGSTTMSMSDMSMSSSMVMPTSTVAAASSSSMSSSMDMSGMSMAASSTSGSMAAGMQMGTSTSSSSMSTNTASANDMGGMNMGMNSYLTPTYMNYPVLFHGLSANTKGKAFGIFLLIVVAAFVYKFTLFVSWCLEVKWFKKWNKGHKSTMGLAAKGLDFYNDEPIQVTHLPKLPVFVFDIFRPSTIELAHDLIRTVLTFFATMLIYMLMLAAMSLVLTYVFAVITGLALAEVFFNRCKICMLKRWQIQAEIEKAKTGENDCQCNPEEDVSSNEKTVLSRRLSNTNEAVDPACCCASRAMEQEKQMENEIMENAKLQEQSGNMDSNLMPAEKFR